jgi:hypothetical protein
MPRLAREDRRCRNPCTSCDHGVVIESAEEFVRLRTSADHDEYWRAAHDEAAEATWRDVIVRFPEMRFWGAQNKTVPLGILEDLRNDPGKRVGSMVRAKCSWRRAHPDDAKRLGDPGSRSAIRTRRVVRAIVPPPATSVSASDTLRPLTAPTPAQSKRSKPLGSRNQVCTRPPSCSGARHFDESR